MQLELKDARLATAAPEDSVEVFAAGNMLVFRGKDAALLKEEYNRQLKAGVSKFSFRLQINVDFEEPTERRNRHKAA